MVVNTTKKEYLDGESYRHVFVLIVVFFVIPWLVRRFVIGVSY